MGDMIYLIGGPPKCGKTTLAKELSKALAIPWTSTDTLQNVIKPYINKEDFPDKFPSSSESYETNDEKYSTLSSADIISNYRRQAKTLFPAIDMFAISEITDGNDFIIEGYHIEPELVRELSGKYPEKIASVFLVKTDVEKFVENIRNSTTPHDWVIRKTQNEGTYEKIAKMVVDYSELIQKEAEEYSLKSVNMDDDFDAKVNEAIDSLKG